MPLNPEPVIVRTDEAKCANPYCDERVRVRGEFCTHCELQQRIMHHSLSRRDLRARRERE